MPSFVSGGTFSASLDKWDVLTINGPGTLQVSVGTSPRFETITFGLQNLGPYAQTAVITGVMSGTGSYSVGPSNTAAGLNQTDISPAQLASPTAAMLAADHIFYRLNVAPFTVYQSNGTALVSAGASSVFTSTTAGIVPASGGGTATFLRADATYASPPGTAYTPFNATTTGLVPASGGGTVAFLRADGAFATPAGGGDMALAGVQTVGGAKTFNDGTVILAGLTSGNTVVKTASVAGASIVTIPATTDILVGRGTTDTLTNKTLTLPVIASIVNGSATLSLPITSDVLVGRSVTETLSNKTLTAPVITGISVAPTQAANDNSTKLATTAYADAIAAVSVTITGTQTVTNKTFTTPSIASILSSGSLLTLPPTVDTLVGRATVDTLTNKTLTAPVITGSSVVPTQAPGDNSTKIASTAYADAIGASKAAAGVFNATTIGQVPASGGGTTSFLRADGVFSSVTAALDSAVVVPAAIAIPLDRAGQGRYMPANLLAAASVLTVGSSPVENGNCVFCLVGDGNATHVPDITAFRMMNGYAYNYVLNAANTYSAVWLYGTPRLYGEQGNDISLILPTLVSAVAQNGAPLTMVLTWSKPVNTTVSAFSAFAISAGHTITAHTYTTATTTTLTFTTAYLSGDVFTTLAYTPPGTNPMQDTATTPNLVAAFASFAITNGVLAAAPTITLSTATSTTQPMTLTAPAGATSRTVQVRTTVGPGAWGNAGGSFVGNVFTATGLTPSTSYDYQASSTNPGGTSAFGATATGSTAAGSSARTDNFTRANSATTMSPPSDGLGNYQIDGVSTPVFGISTNAGYMASNGSGTGNMYATWDRGTTSYTHTLTAKPDGADFILAVFRYTDANNHWRVQQTGSEFGLIKRVVGTDTMVISTGGGAGSPFTFNSATSHTVVIAVTPSGFTVTIDGINNTLNQATDTTFASATRAGLGGYTSGGAGGSRVTAMSTS